MFVCQSGGNDAGMTAPIRENHKGNELAAQSAYDPEPVFVLTVGIVKNEHGPLILKNRYSIRKADTMLFSVGSLFFAVPLKAASG